MSQSSNRPIIVGVFITLGIVIFLVGVFTLGGQQKTFVPSLNVTALFNDVSGLQQGNNVWFSGVKIGTVKKISFFGNAQVKVQLHIDKKAGEYIRKDASVKISTDGLIGNKILVIYGGSPGAASIENNDTLDAHAALNTDDIMATLQKNNENLLAITADFKSVSQKLAGGQGTVGGLLNDNTMYKSLTATLTSLQLAAKHSEQLTANLTAYSTRLQAPGSLANGLVNDTVMIKRLQGGINELQQAAASAHDFTQQLATTGKQLDNRNNVLGLLLYNEKAANSLKKTLDNLHTGSIALNEDLEAAKHNFLLRGFFRRKAKQEKNQPVVVDTIP